MRTAVKSISAFLITASLIMSAGLVHAAGWGLYGLGGTGTFNIDLDFDSGQKAKAKGDALKLGLGFAYDTNVARDELINYRLNIGFENYDMSVDNSSSSESMRAFNIDNTVGFRIINNKTLRFWAGPEVRLGYMKGSGNGFTDDAESIVYGIGGALGVNMQLSQEYAIAFTTGVRNEWYNGTFDSGAGIKGDLDGSGTFGYFTATFLFKSLEDKYSGK